MALELGEQPLNTNGASNVVAMLYGSQTGTAEEVAWDLARQGRRRGFQCADPVALNDIDFSALSKFRLALIVVATTGQGDPPLNMRRLWQEMLWASIPKTALCHLRFALFGLGDSHYREFNYTARKLHARLQGLGAQPFVQLGLGDDQHDFGFEQELDPWAELMWAELAKLCPQLQCVMDAASTEECCRYQVLDVDGETPVHGATRALPCHDDRFDATVLANRSLCTEAHAEIQDVVNMRLTLPPGHSYIAGDVLVVWPRADPELVRRFVVETLGLSLQKRVRIVQARDGIGGSQTASSPFPDRPLSLEEVFSAYIDISAVPTRHFFHVLSLHTDHELHQQKLREFASRTLEAKDALYEYCKRERRSAAEVMWDFWTARPPLAELLGSLPLMRPRRYSIASCPGWYCPSRAPQDAARCLLSRTRAATPRVPILPGRRLGPAESVLTEQLAASGDGHIGRALDLCVAIVKFKTRTGRTGHGLCSHFLRQSKEGTSLRCSLERGSLSLPPLDVPLIMICPGTGLSPCRALVQERHFSILHRNGQAVADRSRFAKGIKDLLFLGFRHQDGDFLYGDEWHTFDAWLNVHIAFSRDHEDCKVYVQDLIERHGEQVCKLLDAGARVYVCGRSHPMPSQVFDALSEVLQVHRGFAAKDAAARLRELQRVQHYICDTWG